MLIIAVIYVYKCCMKLNKYNKHYDSVSIVAVFLLSLLFGLMHVQL